MAHSLTGYRNRLTSRRSCLEWLQHHSVVILATQKIMVYCSNLPFSYKHHATYKALIAVAPDGSFGWVSDCYGGRVTDREIVIKSGFLDQVEKGDHYIADRGFTCQDLFKARGAELQLPPFLNGREKLTLSEDQYGKILSKARVHVERWLFLAICKGHLILGNENIGMFVNTLEICRTDTAFSRVLNCALLFKPQRNKDTVKCCTKVCLTNRQEQLTQTLITWTCFYLIQYIPFADCMR